MRKKQIILCTLAVYIASMILFTVISGYTQISSLPTVIVTDTMEDEVISVDAVYYDELEGPFVYWIVPAETILGTGYKLKAWPVTIEEEKNGKVKALGVRLIGRIAVDCNQEMKDGMYVKIENQ